MKIKNKKVITIFFVICIVLDFGIGFLINKISEDKFDLFSPTNIIVCVILVVLIIIYITLQLLLKQDNTERAQKKKLQKAFQDNGGYEAVVEEMKSCIEKHDYKSIKQLKRLVDYIER